VTRMTRIAALDDALPGDAAALLRSCCGAEQWVHAMVGERPFETLDTLLAVAEEQWWALTPADWLEAFAHHPRIGERTGARAQDERGAAWSAEEQAGASAASDDVRLALAHANVAYEAKFGYVYIVCAAGKRGDELAALAIERLSNDEDTELHVAAEEQRKITRLRLERLFGDDA